VALTLGKDRRQHVGAGNFFATRQLDVDRGALNDPLKGSSRFGLLAITDHQSLEFSGRCRSLSAQAKALNCVIRWGSLSSAA
jgi:hypothetical protein